MVDSRKMKRGRVVCCSNQKGGVGKSGLCQNLGAGLAEKGYKVLLIDLDPQGSLTISFGFRENLRMTIYELINQVMDEELLDVEDMGILKTEEGLDLIPANIKLASAEIALISTIGREFILKQVIEVVRDQYDWIFIDCMPSLGMLTINALVASDEVLIPVEPSFLPLEGLQMLFKTIQKVRRQINPHLKIMGITFALVDARTVVANMNMKAVIDTYGEHIHIFETYISNSVKVKESCQMGMSVIRYAHSSKVAKQYLELVSEVESL